MNKKIKKKNKEKNNDINFIESIENININGLTPLQDTILKKCIIKIIHNINISKDNLLIDATLMDFYDFVENTDYITT